MIRWKKEVKEGRRIYSLYLFKIILLGVTYVNNNNHLMAGIKLGFLRFGVAVNFIIL